MNAPILHQPDFALVRVDLAPGESVRARAGSLVAIQGDARLETAIRGGLGQGLRRAVLAGDSLFQNTYTAQSGGARVYLAPGQPGDIGVIDLAGGPFYLQSGSYLAATGTVTTDSAWGGAQSFFGGEGLFLLQCTGDGRLWFSSFGGIHEVAVSGSYVVDTGAVVGFDSSLTFSVKSVGGLKSLMFSGEGLVCEFSGVGRLFIQTRQPAGFASWLHPFRPKGKSRS